VKANISLRWVFEGGTRMNKFFPCFAKARQKQK
jgi:hypothetical protein